MTRKMLAHFDAPEEILKRWSAGPTKTHPVFFEFDVAFWLIEAINFVGGKSPSERWGMRANNYL